MPAIPDGRHHIRPQLPTSTGWVGPDQVSGRHAGPGERPNISVPAPAVVWQQSESTIRRVGDYGQRLQYLYHYHDAATKRLQLVCRVVYARQGPVTLCDDRRRPER
jgi:hypothetical protein